MIETGLASAGSRPTHPLRAWRESQRIIDHATKQERPWTIADAVRHYSTFIGRPIAYNVWRAWELYRDEDGSRRPSWEDSRGLYAFTRHQVRPDHFHELAELRAMESEAAAEAGCDPSRSSGQDGG